MDAALCIQGQPQSPYFGICRFLFSFGRIHFFLHLLRGKQLITGDICFLLGVIQDHGSGPENIHIKDAVMESGFRAAFVLHGDRYCSVRLFPLGNGHFIRVHGHGTCAVFFQLQHGGHSHPFRVNGITLVQHTEHLVFTVDRKFFRRLRFRSGFFRFSAGPGFRFLLGGSCFLCFSLRRRCFGCSRCFSCSFRFGCSCCFSCRFCFGCSCRRRLGRCRCSSASAGAESVHDQYRCCRRCQ